MAIQYSCVKCEEREVYECEIPSALSRTDARHGRDNSLSLAVYCIAERSVMCKNRVSFPLYPYTSSIPSTQLAVIIHSLVDIAVKFQCLGTSLY
jgi:hypothetical protein